MNEHNAISVISSVDFNVPAILSFVSFLVFFFGGTYVFAANARKTKDVKLFLLFEVFFCFFCLGYTFIHLSSINFVIESGGNKNYGYFFNIVAAIGYCFHIPSVMHFFVSFSKIEENVVPYPFLVKGLDFETRLKIFFFDVKSSPSFYFWRYYVIISYAASLFLFFGILTGENAPIRYETTPFGGLVDIPSMTTIYFFVYIIFLAAWVSSIVFLNLRLKIKFSKNSDGVGKKQINIIFISGLFCMILALLSNVAIPIINSIFPELNMNFPPIGSFFVGVWACFIGYAITEYDFLSSFYEDGLDKVFEISGEVMFYTDVNFDIAKASRVSTAKLGYMKEEFSKFNISDLVSCDKEGFSCSDDNQVISLEEFENLHAVEKSVSMRKQNGTIIYANMKVTLAKRRNINVGILFILSDVTELMGQNEKLEIMVRERTAELVSANENLEKHLQVIGIFAGHSIVTEIRNGKEVLNAKHERRTFCVLSCDIRGFTSMSEELDDQVEVLSSILNHYYEFFGACIKKFGGEVNKYVGDGILCLFSDPDGALSAAICMMKSLPDFNESIRKYYPSGISIGIGISYGNKIIYGSYGASDNKMEVTPIGNDVNLSSRLEELTKSYKVPVIVSSELCEKISGSYSLRFLDEVYVRGKKKPTKIYEVLDYQDSVVVDLKIKSHAMFEEAHQLYRDGKFDEAISKYLRIVKYYEKAGFDSKSIDPIPHVFINRCDSLKEYFRAHPEYTWEGVFENK